MNAPKSKIAAIISYITPLGWIIAYFIRDKECAFTRQHINQGLILALVEIVSRLIARIPLVGGVANFVIDLAVLVFSLMGIYRAAKGSSEPLPFIGDITLIN